MRASPRAVLVMLVAVLVSAAVIVDRAAGLDDPRPRAGAGQVTLRGRVAGFDVDVTYTAEAGTTRRHLKGRAAGQLVDLCLEGDGDAVEACTLVALGLRLDRNQLCHGESR